MRHFNPSMQRLRKKNNPETHLVTQCLTYLRLKGFTAAKLKTHGVWDNQSRAYRLDRNAWTGVPDILVFTPSLTFLELKILPNKIKENTPQDKFRQLCKLAGIPHYEINSIEQLQKIFP